MAAKTMQDMIENILKLVDMNAQNKKNEDLHRTNACAAHANGKASIFQFLNIDYDFGTYMDEEYEMVGYFWVEGVTLVKNGEINWRAYADAVCDEEHAWCSRELKVVERG